MKFKNFIKIFFAILFVFVSTHSYAKTIKWSMQGDSLTLDPHAQNEGPTTQVSRQVYEALVTRGLDMSIEPQLATDWKTTDPNTWVFNLRKGVKFSDGTDMKPKNMLRILLAFLFVFASTQTFAKTIKWSMQGDSLTLDPHAQNEGPTTQVSRLSLIHI